MEVNLSPARIEFVDPTRTISFNGLDMLRAEIGNDPSPPYNTVTTDYYVLIYLDGTARQTYGDTFKVDLRPGIITNQPTWENKPDGAQACVLDIAPIIRAIPAGPFPLVKNSVEYDGGSIQLVGDEATPAADHYYGTDNAGARGYHPLPSGVTDVIGTAPISVAGATTKTVSHDTTAATPGSYLAANITVDQWGHITAASNGTPVEDLGYAPIMLLMGG